MDAPCNGEDACSRHVRFAAGAGPERSQRRGGVSSDFNLNKVTHPLMSGIYLISLFAKNCQKNPLKASFLFLNIRLFKVLMFCTVEATLPPLFELYNFREDRRRSLSMILHQTPGGGA